MKKRGILCGLACTILMTSCGIMPAEEQLPSAPVSKEVQEIEHVMTIVQKGDIAVEEVVQCTYKPAKSEKRAFTIGGEYIETIYVEAGESVKKGDLLAELDMGDLPEQLENQEYGLETLQMNKRHIEQQRNLAVRRCNLQIQLTKEQLADLGKNTKSAASSAEMLSEDPEENTESVPESSEDMDSSDSEDSRIEESSGQPEESIDTESSSESEITSETESSSEPEVSSEPVSSQPESAAKPDSSSQPEMSSKPETSINSEENEEPEEPVDPQEPEIDPEAAREQLNQTLKTYNQNLTKIQNQYSQQLKSIEDSIYIQQKRIEELKESIQKRQIYAGIDGAVTFVRDYEEGAVSIEDETVFIISDVESSVFFVTGEDTEYLKIGDTVSIEYNKEAHEAHVIAPDALGLPESEDGEVVRYLKLAQPDPSLEEGTGGKIRIVVESRQDVLFVKNSVIKSIDGKSIVYYLDESGLKNYKEVETGLSNGDFVEIVSGLEENEEIIDE